MSQDWQGQPPGQGGPPGYGPQGYGPGYGGPPGYGPYGPGYPPPKKSSGAGCVIAIVLGIAIVPILLALAIYGTRRYLQSAKTSEAKNNVGALARGAQRAFEETQPDGTHRLCPSATKGIPDKVPSGTKYVASPAEWDLDKARNGGFFCLKTQFGTPMYYQYTYTSSADGFVVTARGDLDADGVESVFEIRGRVVGGRVELSPLQITNEFE